MFHLAKGKVVEACTELEHGCSILLDSGDVDNLSRVACNLAVAYRTAAKNQPDGRDLTSLDAQAVTLPSGQVLFSSHEAACYAKAVNVLNKVREHAKKTKSQLPTWVNTELCKSHLVWGFSLSNACRVLAKQGNLEETSAVAEAAYEQLNNAVTEGLAHSPESLSSHLLLGALEVFVFLAFKT